DSKFSLLGSMRTCAQLVSYEVSLSLAVLGVVIMGRSLSLVDIVHRQDETIWFAAPQLVGLLVFFIAGTAETSRAPFDLPEADTLRLEGAAPRCDGQRRRHGRAGGGVPVSPSPVAPVKGFAVTLRQIFKKPVTQEYPEYKRPVYPRFRGRHRLWRHENGLEKC